MLSKFYLTIILVALFQFSYSQTEYFPLKVGNIWMYDLEADIPDDIDTLTWVIASEESIQLNEMVKVYELLSINKNDTFARRIYITESNPNELVFVDYPEEVVDLDCEFKLLLEYTEGDTIMCDGDSDRISEYHGTYETNEGLVFEDCWTLAEFDGEEREDIYFIAPNVGMIAYIKDAGDTIPNVEIISFDFLSSDLDVTENLDLQLYPNPTDGILNLTSDVDVSADYIYILDMKGSIVKREEYNPSAKINTTDISQGQYLIVIQKDNRVIWRDKFIKI